MPNIKKLCQTPFKVPKHRHEDMISVLATFFFSLFHLCHSLTLGIFSQTIPEKNLLNLFTLLPVAETMRKNIVKYFLFLSLPSILPSFFPLNVQKGLVALQYYSRENPDSSLQSVSISLKHFASALLGFQNNNR